MATGDITATILKIVSAVASTKVAFKFIFIAVFLVLLYFFLYNSLESLGMPSKVIHTVIPLMSVGMSVILVEFVNYFILKNKKSNEIANQKRILKEEIKNKKEQEDNFNQDKLTSFKHAFPYLKGDSKQILWASLKEEFLLNNSFKYDHYNKYKELFDHNALVTKTFVNQNEDLYILSPIFREFVQEEYEKIVIQEVANFKRSLSNETEKLLEIFVNPTNERKYNLDSFYTLTRSPLFYGKATSRPPMVNIGIKKDYRDHLLGLLEDTFGNVDNAIYEIRLDETQLYLSERQ